MKSFWHSNFGRTLGRTGRVTGIAFTLLAGVGMFITAPAQAASQHSEIVVAGQSTHATPSIAQLGTNPSTSTLYVAYTGDNSAHNIYVTSSSETSLSFSHPVEIADTAQAGTGPAICAFNGQLWIVWAGSDASGYLYVGNYVPGNPNLSYQTAILSNTTRHTPTYSALGNSLYVGWVGVGIDILPTAKSRGIPGIAP